jgi:hypothetical protein
MAPSKVGNSVVKKSGEAETSWNAGAKYTGWPAFAMTSWNSTFHPSFTLS